MFVAYSTFSKPLSRGYVISMGIQVGMFIDYVR